MSPKLPSAGVRWNAGALAVAGVAGIALNYWIGLEYGAAALGLFNQVFALYIVFSQLAALGVHQSVLVHVAAQTDTESTRALLVPALIVALALSSVAAWLFVLGAEPFAALLGSEDVREAAPYAAPALVFFAASKVLIACANGQRRMRLYAVLFASRFVFLLVALALHVLHDGDAASLPVILTLAEGATLLLSVLGLRRELGAVSAGDFKQWSVRHWRFGLRGLAGGLLAELNTRVDVLMLGAFASDELVGAYSFAAVPAEGFFQLLVVLRTNYNPKIGRLLADGKQAEVRALVRKYWLPTTLFMLAVATVAVPAYYYVVGWTTEQPLLVQSWQYFAILLGGTVLAAGFVPFSQVLLMAGRPGAQSWFVVAILTSNIALNAVLIPLLGAVGAALATAGSYVAIIVVLKVMSARILGLHL